MPGMSGYDLLKKIKVNLSLLLVSFSDINISLVNGCCIKEKLGQSLMKLFLIVLGFIDSKDLVILSSENVPSRVTRYGASKSFYIFKANLESSFHAYF
jgi:hypothetical protein